jgi:dTDP-4-amino-4,6-dideoxygalactose transaminase
MNPIHQIPFNKASIEHNEILYITEALRSGQIAGDQYFSKKSEQLLGEYLDAKRVLITTSCTHALEMAAALIGIQPGDEIIVPSFTFVSTANAFVAKGAKPVFCDIRSDTLNIDEHKITSLISNKTKAIVPVHYAGVGCEMDKILRIAEERNLSVVEDNAHGLFGKYKSRPLGGLAPLATQSFHETKNIACGEGGALVINDSKYIQRAEILREKGTNRNRFFRGEVDKYTWVDVGSSYVMSDLLAAFLYAKLEISKEIQSKREQIWTKYNEGLKKWSNQNNVRQPFVPVECEQAWHMYYLIMPKLHDRDILIEKLKRKGIKAVFHYVPLHTSQFARENLSPVHPCPVAEDIADRLVRLPFYNTLTASEQDYVIESINAITL